MIDVFPGMAVGFGFAVVGYFKKVVPVIVKNNVRDLLVVSFVTAT